MAATNFVSLYLHGFVGIFLEYATVLCLHSLHIKNRLTASTLVVKCFSSMQREDTLSAIYLHCTWKEKKKLLLSVQFCLAKNGKK